MSPPSAHQRQFGIEEAPLTLGTIRGIREWMPRKSVVLHGLNHCAWVPGVNVAECLVPTRVMTDPKHPRPPECGMVGLDCTCGFYAYWNLAKPSQSVIGVIEGWGRTVIGPKGFRCEKARILALAPRELSWRDTTAANWRITQEMAVAYGVPAYPTVRQMLAAYPIETPDGVPQPSIGDLIEAMPHGLGQLVLFGFSDAAYWIADRVDHLTWRVGKWLRGIR